MPCNRKNVQKPMISIVNRIARKRVEFNEEKCKKTVENVVQVTQRTGEVFVVISVGMYYNVCIME